MTMNEIDSMRGNEVASLAPLDVARYKMYNSELDGKPAPQADRDYIEFLASKRTISQTVGIEVSLDEIHPLLFPFQRTLVQWALRKGRAALFADTGLGKTLMQAEWARLTGQRALIVAPLSVARQTVNEAAKIGVLVHYTRSGNDLIEGINITNYEMISHFNPDDFGAVVLDESSILKSIDGETKSLLIEMFSSTPYRLACTATPAPNDQVEIANHAEFLGVMSRTEMLATFFVHDSANGSGTGWRLKGHAYDAFYKWMASWSMSIKKPSDLGFSDDGYILPALSVERVIVGTDYAPTDQLFFTGLKGITDRSRARKGTIEERVQCAVDLVSYDADQWILWCGMNDESAALARSIPDSIEITGSDSPDAKIAAIEAFQRGDVRVLVTKPKIAGFGINLQNCHKMAFVGIGDSFESYYQCLRRCFRFGQQYPVQSYVIISEIEQEIYQNVIRKEQEAASMSEQLIARVKSFEREEIEQSALREEYATSTVKNSHYTLMQGDSCERLAEIPDSSVGLTVTSIPFQDLYCYSPTERDLGNSKGASEFYQHLSYIIAETLRVTQPGRDACVHVQQVAASLVKDGFIGLKDFRGEVVRAFCDQGWIYHGEITVDKNPQAQAVRTKAKGLLFVQLRKDSSWMRPGLADYILIFRKPGENATPIHTDLTNDEWIKFAHPVWYDIRESDTLNAAEARESDDEKHVCPLQLSLIERCIRLWSNPGELVLDPFMGIGSTGYEAIHHGRRFVGCELKPAYAQAARKNMDRMIRSQAQVTLWAGIEEEAEVIA
jgi:DNA modification methylase